MSVSVQFLKSGLSAVAVSAILSGTALYFGIDQFTPTGGAAFAESHEEGGHEGGHEGGGGGQGGGGHEDGEDHEDDGGHEGGQGGQGYQGGQNEQGGQGYQGGEGGGGSGRPVWAGEGIPEVELGRLNVIRSPTQVLNRAFIEAQARFTIEMVEFYNLSIDEAVVKLTQEFATTSMIDSPLQNLALFEDALDGSSILNELPEISNDNNTLLAMFLGAASDKAIPVTRDTVLAVSIILGQPLSEAEATALAADAERIRVAIAEGHG